MQREGTSFPMMDRTTRGNGGGVRGWMEPSCRVMGVECQLVIMWVVGVLGLLAGAVLGSIASGRFGTVTAVFAALLGAVGALGVRMWVWWYRDLRPHVDIPTRAAPWSSSTSAYGYLGQAAWFIAVFLVATAVVAWVMEVTRHVDTTRGKPLSWWLWVATALTIVGVSGGIVALRAASLMERRLGGRLTPAPAEPLDAVVRQYREVAGRVRGILAYFGLIATLLQVTLGAATNELLVRPPQEIVLLIGLALTGVMAIVSLPPRSLLAHTAEAVIGHSAPAGPDTTPAARLEWLRLRHALRDELTGGNRLLVAIEAALVILGPLVAAGVSLSVTGI